MCKERVSYYLKILFVSRSVLDLYFFYDIPTALVDCDNTIRIILPKFLSFIYLLLLFYHHFFALTRRLSPDLSVARVVF